MSDSDGQSHLDAGRVGRAHGLDGSFYVTRAVSRLLSVGANVSVAGRDSEIVRRAGTEQRPIVRLDGVVDRAGAEALRGTPLLIARTEAPALAEGEWWAHELEGCEVLDGTRRIGTVRRLLELPSCEVLEVQRGPHEQILLVPMVKDAVRSVDAHARRIQVDVEFLGLDDEPSGTTPEAGTGEPGEAPPDGEVRDGD